MPIVVLLSLLDCGDASCFWVLVVGVLGEAEWAFQIGMHNFISNAKQFIKQYCVHFIGYNSN
jgi:hypothetical protein